jgi:hypothetical protein
MLRGQTFMLDIWKRQKLELFYNLSQISVGGQIVAPTTTIADHFRNIVRVLSYSPLAVALAAIYVKKTTSVQDSI